MRALVRPVAEWEIARAIIPPACQRMLDDLAHLHVASGSTQALQQATISGTVGRRRRRIA
jgi:hypothetical protein